MATKQNEIFLSIVINGCCIASYVVVPYYFGMKTFFICLGFLFIQTLTFLWNKDD